MNTQQLLKEAVATLRDGGVVLYPAETVWGIGCDPLNEKAVEKVFELKQRDPDKALILLISDIGQLYDYVDAVPEIAWDIVELADEPLTVVYPKGKRVAKQIMADDGSIAVRLVTEGFCFELIRRFGKAITSTSANFSGQPTPKDFAAIDENLKNACDFVIEGVKPEGNYNKPSKIIKLGSKGEFTLIRD